MNLQNSEFVSTILLVLLSALLPILRANRRLSGNRVLRSVLGNGTAKDTNELRAVTARLESHRDAAIEDLQQWRQTTDQRFVVMGERMTNLEGHFHGMQTRILNQLDTIHQQLRDMKTAG